MSATRVVCQRCQGGHQASNCPGLNPHSSKKRKSDNAEGREMSYPKCYHCKSIYHDARACNLNGNKKAKVAERDNKGIRCTKCKSKIHDTVNCDEVKLWEQNSPERTLRNFVIPDHDILTVPFNPSDNFNALVNRILSKNGKYIGGFVARAVEPRSTELLDSFKFKKVTGSKMTVKKLQEGVYGLEYSRSEKKIAFPDSLKNQRLMIRHCH